MTITTINIIIPVESPFLTGTFGAGTFGAGAIIIA